MDKTLQVITAAAVVASGSLLISGLIEAPGGMWIKIVLPDNQKIPLKVDSSDSLEKVKEKIQHEIGIKKDADYRLFFNGRKLDGDLTLNNFNILTQSDIHLIFPDETAGEEVQIFVKIFNGTGSNIIPLDVERSDTIFVIKQMIHKSMPTGTFPTHLLRLEFAGVWLGNNNFTLADYKIKDKSTLSCMLLETNTSIQVFVKITDLWIITVKLILTDSITSVKERIRTIARIKKYVDFELSFAGCPLHDDRMLTEFDIQKSNESTMHIIFTGRKWPQVLTFVETSSGIDVYFIDPSASVLNLKEGIQVKERIPTCKQHLFYNGVELKDHCTLRSLGIHGDNKIEMREEPVPLLDLLDAPSYVSTILVEKDCNPPPLLLFDNCEHSQSKSQPELLWSWEPVVGETEKNEVENLKCFHSLQYSCETRPLPFFERDMQVPESSKRDAEGNKWDAEGNNWADWTMCSKLSPESGHKGDSRTHAVFLTNLVLITY